MVLGGAARISRSIRSSRRPTAPDGRMTLVEHLRELRRRIFVAALAIVVGSIVAFLFHHRLLNALESPYCNLPDRYHPIETRNGSCVLYVSGITDGFLLTVKLSIYAGLILSSPVWLYQLWGFITPGLYRHERRWAVGFVAASVFLFALGGAFAWFTLNRGLRFLLGFASGHGLAALLTFSSYISFVTAMILIFAVSFEFPLVVTMLNLAGVLSYERLRRWTRGIIFGIFVFAGVATPSQDAITMLGLAVPMTVLFGISLLLAYVHDRRRPASIYEDLDDDEASSITDDSVDTADMT